MSETSDSQQSLPPYQSPEKSVPNSCVTSTKKQGHWPKGSLNVQYFFCQSYDNEASTRSLRSRK